MLLTKPTAAFKICALAPICFSNEHGECLCLAYTCMQREIQRICEQLQANDPTSKYIDHLMQAEVIFDRQERMRIRLEQTKLASLVAALSTDHRSIASSSIGTHM